MIWINGPITGVVRTEGLRRLLHEARLAVTRLGWLSNSCYETIVGGRRRKSLQFMDD